ncbi:uncharacterized protein LY89DRAFT_786952 [Mollisia scopiformis]|uniref:Zn(2)-C6 fungal-type domain-containing protein n=1 Tax=Mollisia scopiformis TaxID=149040 RepID=A0A194WTQ9_MOLSC|nr:uncharacterized protein LY89DRAFT_786952 [Mollisia scopiformis]KUJ11340.1 hypothetical protein LY89DRAFT_786952 [Mollisia scopiformis]
MARLGVGKSGGCRNCRRRKVKCDEHRPGCKRCEKSNQECEGYTREHRFVDENFRTEKHVKKKASTETPQPDPRSSQDIILHSNSSSGLTAMNLEIHAFQDNIFMSFLLSNLFSGIPVVTPWLRLHAEDTSSASAQLSTRALSTVFFGRTHYQHNITARGYNLYGQALISLNQDLQDSKKGQSLSVVKTAMALELYEFIASNTSGWIKHAGGVGRLLELRGPQLHQSPQGREIFEASRAIIALGYLVKRKRCFLESTEWKTIPWALEPEAKTSVMFLHDIACDLPGVMEDVDQLQSPQMSPEEFIKHHAFVSGRITSCLKELYGWRASWQRQNPHACWEVLSTDSTTGSILFPLVFNYKSLIEANALTFYNALLLLLLKVASQVIGPQFDPSTCAAHLPRGLRYEPLIPPGLAPNAQAIAYEICKSVEYLLGAERRRAGAFFLLFPLRVAWQAFNPVDMEAVWLQGIMRIIADSTGFEVSRGLMGEVVQSED